MKEQKALPLGNLKMLSAEETCIERPCAGSNRGQCGVPDRSIDNCYYGNALVAKVLTSALPSDG